VIRSAVLGLLIYALGLVPFYFLTPAHQAIDHLLGRSTSTVDENAFLTRTQSTKPAKVVGADASSVVDTTPVADETPIPVPTAAASDSQFAVLLLGYGGGSHDGSYLTDSMMVVVVDPSRKTLTLLSLPRDSWVPLLFDGKTAVYNKVNTAYAFAKDPTLYTNRLDRYTGDQGAGLFAADTVSRLLGIPVRYYLGLDFQGFRDMINAVGGIDVDVPDGFAARYPRNDDPSVDASWMVVRFQPGEQHMDGERAIEYARARETIDDSNEGSDFARSRRQRLIMESFKTRLLQPGGLIHLPELLAIASQHLDTNYSIPNVAQLSQLILGWKDVKIYQTALTTANYLEDATGPDGAYVAVPGAPDHSWAQIRAFARHLWTDPAAGVAMASTTIIVENDTGVAGVAGRVSDALIKLGYQVGEPTTGERREHSQLDDQTGGKAGPLAQRLEADLGIDGLDVVDPPPDGSNDKVVVHLGTDLANIRLTATADRSAPYSTVGVIKFGVWPYVPPQPTATPTSIPQPSRAPASRSPLPNSSSVRAPTEQKGTTVVVPSLIGMSSATAQRLVVAEGLKTTYLNYQTIDQVSDRQYFLSIPPGHVLSQSPRPGLQVPRGTTVYLAVRK